MQRSMQIRAFEIWDARWRWPAKAMADFTSCQENILIDQLLIGSVPSGWR
jgi:hypothetical protein